jgi:hypothetical protein
MNAHAVGTHQLTRVRDAFESRVAGDPERIHMSKCDEMGGISYHENFISWMNRLAEELDIEKMKLVD